MSHPWNGTGAARACVPLLALALAFLGGPASARPEADAERAMRNAAAKARKALPEPTETNGFAYEGEVWIEGMWAATVKLAAEAGTHEDKPAWVVAEEVFWDHGTEDWRLVATYTLARDLALLRAEVDVHDRGTLTRWSLLRSEKGLEGQKQVVKGGEEGPFETVLWPAPAGATAGYAALALFARGPLPAKEPAFEFAWVDPGAWPRGREPVVPALHLDVTGETTFDALTAKPATVETRLTGASVSGSVHLAKKDRTLVGWKGLLHEKAVVVPKGAPPEGAKFDEKAPARTWKDAFLKFGIGYHMAKADLLAAAFHWETMYEYETSLVDGWPKERPVADFRKAWIDAFLADSKHRPRSETDELLRMTIQTGKVETKGEDRVLFRADKKFGGGQVQRDYHLKRIDGVWYIVRMDSNE